MYKIVSLKMLRFSVGIFFIILGLAGILPAYDEGIFSLTGSYSTLEALFGIIEILCGLVLVAGLFTILSRKITNFAGIGILIFWGLRVVLTRFIWGFHPGMPWLLALACELIIFFAILSVYRAYE